MIDDVRITKLRDVTIINAEDDVQVTLVTLPIDVTASAIILAPVVFNGTFSLDFSSADNSGYVPLLEDI